MDTALIVAIIAAIVSVSATVANAWVARRNADLASRTAHDLEHLRQELQRDVMVTRYREPLARSAYDLQSRLYNIVVQRFLERYLAQGGERERIYAVENTTFLIAQFFCWSELVRRDIQFIDLDHEEASLRLAHLQDQLYSAWRTDDWPAPFRFFAGEQRAIGEALVRSEGSGSGCIGYGAFLKELGPGANELLDCIRNDVRLLGESGSGHGVERLIALQGALIDLLALLDPECRRFPARTRSKIAASR